MGQTIKYKMYMKIKGNINKFNHMLPERILGTQNKE